MEQSPVAKKDGDIGKDVTEVKVLSENQSVFIY